MLHKVRNGAALTEAIRNPHSLELNGYSGIHCRVCDCARQSARCEMILGGDHTRNPAHESKYRFGIEGLERAHMEQGSAHAAAVELRYSLKSPGRHQAGTDDRHVASFA